jgi:rhodanese-related sulfurtransferase
MLCAGCQGQAQQATNLPVDQFEREIAADVQVLDVRTAAEYQQGHLKNAFLADWNKSDQFFERVQALDKSKPIYIYCLSGARSAAATQWLRANGFTAYNLDGGIAAWKRSGKPIEGLKSVKQISWQEYQVMLPPDKTVLVDVSASWCPPCKKMEPVVDSLVGSIGNTFQLLRIDGGEQTELSRQLGVETFPVFIVYKNQKEVWRKQGILAGSTIAAAIR